MRKCLNAVAAFVLMLLAAPSFATSTETSSTSGANVLVKSVVATGTTGNTIYVVGFPVGLAISPSGGASCKVQISMSSFADLAATAVWVDWAAGSVSAATTSYAQGPISAVRGVSVSTGACTLEVSYRK